MTFQDGSWYDGDWDCGLRHGVGEYHQIINEKTTIYKGQWYNDLKHGVGEEEFPEVQFKKFHNVKGIWYHNQLNGVGRFGRKRMCCPENKTVCFKDGMSLDMT